MASPFRAMFFSPSPLTTIDEALLRSPHLVPLCLSWRNSLSHPAAIPDPDLLKHCHIGKGRSSGPGGQHRNKVETLVIITHEPTGISAHAGERRSAEENKRVALRRLRLALAVQVRRPVAIGDARSPLWRSRVSPDGHIACNPRHADFPALLAEALDTLDSTNHDPRKAAARLCCTPSQLLKLLKAHPPALESLNAARAARKKHPLK